MDKGRRQELRRLHYKKRKRYYQLGEDDWHSLKSDRKPCSCHLCKGERYSRKEKHKEEYEV